MVDIYFDIYLIYKFLHFCWHLRALILQHTMEPTLPWTSRPCLGSQEVDHLRREDLHRIIILDFLYESISKSSRRLERREALVPQILGFAWQCFIPYWVDEMRYICMAELFQLQQTLQVAPLSSCCQRSSIG